MTSVFDPCHLWGPCEFLLWRRPEGRLCRGIIVEREYREGRDPSTTLGTRLASLRMTDPNPGVNKSRSLALHDDLRHRFKSDQENLDSLGVVLRRAGVGDGGGRVAV